MKDLLCEYRQSLENVKKVRESAPDEDQKIYAGMVGSLDFVTKWLAIGRMPERSKSYGSYPSEAFLNLEEDWANEAIDPFSRGAFEEVEDRIDAEIKKRRKMNA